MKYPILALFLITLSFCSQDVPIQANQYGFSVGDQYGTLHIQFFLDFQCTIILTKVLIPKIHSMSGQMSANQSVCNKTKLN